MLGIANLLAGPVAEILDKVIVDQDEKARLSYEIATLAERQAHELSLAQVEVNRAEAANAGYGWMGLFRAGWRPACAWMGVIAMGWHMLLQPLILFLCVIFGAEIPPMPEFDMGSLMTILLGLLGLGTMRSLERIQGVEPR